MHFALLAFVTAAAGYDVDAVGLSALERSAIVERARTELAVQLVDAPGLVACSDDPSETAQTECASAAIESAGAIAGAAVRVVKVLQVVRVELTVFDRDGTATARSLRTLDIEGAARGPLFDEAAVEALAVLAPRPREVARPPEKRSGAPKQGAPGEGPSLQVVAVAVGIGGAAIALAGGAAAANEALLANSPTSSGQEKERARVLGPLAVGIVVLGVVVAVGAPIALMLASE